MRLSRSGQTAARTVGAASAIAEIVHYKLFTSDAIARFFGVSPAAACVRLNDLEEIGELKKKP